MCSKSDRESKQLSFVLFYAENFEILIAILAYFVKRGRNITVFLHLDECLNIYCAEGEILLYYD